jgi:hypothetical protein
MFQTVQEACYNMLHSLKGTNTVKYITPLPCIGLSESDLKLYIKFEFYEGKHHKDLKNTLIYKAK